MMSITADFPAAARYAATRIIGGWIGDGSGLRRRGGAGSTAGCCCALWDGHCGRRGR